MLQNYTTWTIAKVFFEEPKKEHYLKDISRRTGIAHTSVAQHLKTLLQQQLITKHIEKKGSRTFPLYKAAENDIYRFYKKIFNIISIQELVKYLQDQAPTCIVLFGSYSRGEDTEDSDIDIYLQAPHSNIDVKRFERQLKHKIQLHMQADFKRYPEELKNNIINGVILAGYLEAL